MAHTYTFTITAVVDAVDQDDAWDQWVDLLTQPRFLEDGTTVTVEAARPFGLY
jgi:hypothetical protein